MTETAASGIPVFVSAFLLQALQFGFPTYLLARRQPQREGFCRRIVLACLGILLVNAMVTLLTYVGIFMAPSPLAHYALNFIGYSLYLVALVALVLLCFETSVWNALFCATAGYTIQNLGSGMGELVRILVRMATGGTVSSLLEAVISNTCIALVILVCHFIYIRKVDGIGRLGKDSRNMLGMLVLVIMGVIAFDVLVRGLEREGAALGFMASLRVVHFAVSAFILFAEYEMLYNVRLKAENAARERISAERERQYELSRETIAAVNRRVHDIRHKVVSDLAASETPPDRELLASVARDINVFDTQVKTGNEVLDTILTEKSLLCARRGVKLSCIADGTAVSTLPTADLYALFGGLLDEAIEAVCAQPDATRRSISLTLRQLGELALLHVEHYGMATGNLDELRLVVERYGGTITRSAQDGTTSIDAMMPVG